MINFQPCWIDAYARSSSHGPSFENQRNGHIRWPSAVAAFTDRSCAGYYIPVSVKTGNSGVAHNADLHVFARNDNRGIRIQRFAELGAGHLGFHIGNIVRLADATCDECPVIRHQAGLFGQVDGLGRKVGIDNGPDVIGISCRCDR